MSLRWLPSTTLGYMVGDYVSASLSGTSPLPALAVARAPSGGLLDEAMDVATGLTSASVATALTASAAGPVLSTAADHPPASRAATHR